MATAIDKPPLARSIHPSIHANQDPSFLRPAWRWARSPDAVRDASGAYRVLYVAALVEAVYVLHSFQKKTQATPQRDLDLATLRYRLLRQERQ
jgi:hypothetical protein